MNIGGSSDGKFGLAKDKKGFFGRNGQKRISKEVEPMKSPLLKNDLNVRMDLMAISETVY